MRIALGLLGFCALANAGCSAHPLVDDVVRIELHQIVDRIRCEAVKVVQAIFEGEYAAAKIGAKQDLAGAYKAYQDSEQNIKADQGYLKKLTDDAIALEAKREDLVQRIKLYELKMEKAALDLLDGQEQENAAQVLHKRARILRELIRRAAVEEFRFKKETTQYRIDVQAANARARYYESELSKERKYIKQKYNKIDEFLRHRFTYQLDFKMTNKSTLGSDMSYKMPIPFGTLTIDQINPKAERENTSTRVVRAVASFGELLKLRDHCNQDSLDAGVSPLRARSYPIIGEIGLKEVIVQYMKIISDDDKIALKPKDTEAYSDKIVFKTTLSGGVVPKIQITQAGHSFTGNYTMTATRQDEHTLQVLMTLEDENDNDKTGKSGATTKVEIVKGIRILGDD
jgi:hypothetical protein